MSLARLWSALAPELRSPRQMVGRQWEGCAATIGAMPRCDFDCTSCYLPRSANRSKPAPLETLFEQLELIAASFGPWGNVQLTDGEITLRQPDELVALVRRAVELQLIPMVMTHGESFLRDPALLERLVVEGGLRAASDARGVPRLRLDPERSADRDAVGRRREGGVATASAGACRNGADVPSALADALRGVEDAPSVRTQGI